MSEMVRTIDIGRLPVLVCGERVAKISQAGVSQNWDDVGRTEGILDDRADCQDSPRVSVSTLGVSTQRWLGRTLHVGLISNSTSRVGPGGR